MGFWAKLFVLNRRCCRWVTSGSPWWAVLFSLIGAFYYLRVVKLMYFDAPTDAAPIDPRADIRALMSANGLAVLVFGLAPGSLLAIANAQFKLSWEYGFHRKEDFLADRLSRAPVAGERG